MRGAPYLIAAGVAVLLSAGLGRLPLLDPAEGRYPRAAQEMMEGGDFLVPHLEGVPRLQKPVLFYWIEAAALAAFGHDEAAARLPSALAALATLLSVYVFARRRLGERTALLGCVILATTPLFFGLARIATTDMTLTLLVFGATAGLYTAIVEEARPLRNILLGGACLGLALLTKGPVAILIPAVAIPVGAAVRGRPAGHVARRAAVACLVTAAVAAPWTILLLQRVGWEHALEIWRRETVERFAGGLDHPESGAYFFQTSPLVFFPWSALIPFALYAAAREIRRRDGLRALLLAWLLGGFVFFALGRGKLDVYLLPLAPAGALLVAATAADAAVWRQGIRWAAPLLALIGAALAAAAWIGEGPGFSALSLPVVALIAALCALAAAALAAARRADLAPAALAAIAAAALLSAALLAPERLVEARSTRTLAIESGLAGFDGPVYIHRIDRPSLGFYLRRHVTYAPARSRLLRQVQGSGPAAVILEERRGDVVASLLTRGFRVVARRGGLVAMRRPAPSPTVTP